MTLNAPKLRANGSSSILISRLCWLAVALWGSGVSSTELFVSPRGDDTSQGTRADLALATIQHAVSRLHPGDSLTILPGEYRETVLLSQLKGTSQQPITIRAARPGTVVIRGDLEATGWSLEQAGEYSIPWNHAAEGVADPRHVMHYALAPSFEELHPLAGGFYLDQERRRLVVRTPDGAPPTLLNVSTTNGNGFTLERCAHLVIEGLAFTGFQHADFSILHGSRTRWGILVGRSEGIAIRHCIAYLNSGGICLTSGSVNCRVEYCEVFGNTSRTITISNQILGWGARECLFRRNRIEGFNTSAGSQDQITFYSNDGSSNRLEENVAIRGGFMDKGDAQNVQVVRNLTTGLRPQFYRPEDASNLRVPYRDPQRLSQQFADPVRGDFRLLPDSPLRGQGLAGADPGPDPYREEVFFVSPDGNDAALGTSPQRAWKTLKQAAERARPGDTVYLLAGVYEEPLRPSRSGSAARSIRFARRGEDRVILDGGGKHPVGIDLTGRSHIAIDGIHVRGFTQLGVRLQGSEAVTLSQGVFSDIGGDALAVRESRGVTVLQMHVDRIGGAGLRLELCGEVNLLGNQWSGCGTTYVHCDSASLASLWSDRNHFSPVSGSGIGWNVAGTPLATLADWQATSAVDEHSLMSESGILAPPSEPTELSLAVDSPLIGRGPRGEAIGPFRRMTIEQAVRIENAQLHRTTATTANLECQTPSAPVEVILEWGPTAALGQTLADRPALFHTMSLTGLEPGKEYHALFRTTSKLRQTIFAVARLASGESDQRESVATQVVFRTPAAEPARTFHVSPSGDDRRDGLSVDGAWRTLRHAASQAVAGDTVLVHAGTYEESVLIRGTGDVQAPVTFRSAPGEVVWLSGSDRNRPSAFQLTGKSHVIIDGFRFRDFQYQASNLQRVIALFGGSNHVVRRCFYDGRVTSGYMNGFLGIVDSPDTLIENCVMIQGMGEGLAISGSPRSEIRHCVFYNNNIRAMSLMGNEPGCPVTLSHNLICAVIPAKSNNGLIRIGQLSNLQADHNGYFDREGETERAIYEVFYIGEQEVGESKPGAYHGRKVPLAEVRDHVGQERHSFFGNPGIAVAKRLAPRFDRQDPTKNERDWSTVWLANDMQQTRREIRPLDFEDFFAAPDGPFARSPVGRPIGLDPSVFSDLPRSIDRGQLVAP